MGRKPIFKGSSARDQLELIVRVLGMPSADDLKAYATERANGTSGARTAETIERMPATQPQDLRRLYPEASMLCVDLLRRMLVFDPAKRISVDEALEHPWLADLHARSAEPVCRDPFDFSFEHEYPDEMPKRLLQQHIHTRKPQRQTQPHSG